MPWFILVTFFGFIAFSILMGKLKLSGQASGAMLTLLGMGGGLLAVGLLLLGVRTARQSHTAAHVVFAHPQHEARLFVPGQHPFQPRPLALQDGLPDMPRQWDSFPGKAPSPPFADVVEARVKVLEDRWNARASLAPVASLLLSQLVPLGKSDAESAADVAEDETVPPLEDANQADLASAENEPTSVSAGELAPAAPQLEATPPAAPLTPPTAPAVPLPEGSAAATEAAIATAVEQPGVSNGVPSAPSSESLAGAIKGLLLAAERLTQLAQDRGIEVPESANPAVVNNESLATSALQPSTTIQPGASVVTRENPPTNIQISEIPRLEKRPSWVQEAETSGSNAESILTVLGAESEAYAVSKLYTQAMERVTSSIHGGYYSTDPLILPSNAETRIRQRLQNQFIHRILPGNQVYVEAERRIVAGVPLQVWNAWGKLNLDPGQIQAIRGADAAARVEYQTWHRLLGVGFGSGAVLSTILCMFGLFKLDTATKGHYTARILFVGCFLWFGIVGVITMMFLDQMGFF